MIFFITFNSINFNSNPGGEIVLQNGDIETGYNALISYMGLKFMTNTEDVKESKLHSSHKM